MLVNSCMEWCKLECTLAHNGICTYEVLLYWLMMLVTSCMEWCKLEWALAHNGICTYEDGVYSSKMEIKRVEKHDPCLVVCKLSL